MPDAVTLRPYRPADRDWLVAQHARLYARDDGFDDSFGPLVGDILDRFARTQDPTCEAGWIAQQGGQRLGSIFCVRHSAHRAKLRLFLVLPEARGAGLGRVLLARCTAFAQGAGYQGMTLWTHESHRAACGLYRAAGWQLTASKPVHSFGQDLIEQTYDLAF